MTEPWSVVALVLMVVGVGMLGWFAIEIRRQGVRDRQRAAQDEAWLANIRARYEPLAPAVVITDANTRRGVMMGAEAAYRAGLLEVSRATAVLYGNTPSDDDAFLRSLGIKP